MCRRAFTLRKSVSLPLALVALAFATGCDDPVSTQSDQSDLNSKPSHSEAISKCRSAWGLSYPSGGPQTWSICAIACYEEVRSDYSGGGKWYCDDLTTHDGCRFCQISYPDPTKIGQGPSEGGPNECTHANRHDVHCPL